MSTHGSVPDTESDGEDFFTCSLRSEDLSRTIRDLGCLLYDHAGDACLPVDDSDDAAYDPVLQPGACSPASVFTDVCGQTSSSPDAVSPLNAGAASWVALTLPAGCGEAFLIDLMRQHIVPPQEVRLASVGSVEVATKLSTHVNCTALKTDSVSVAIAAMSGASSPFSHLALPPSQGAPGYVRLEQYRHWLKDDGDGDEAPSPGSPSLAPHRPVDDGRTATKSTSADGQRRRAPSLSSVRMTQFKPISRDPAQPQPPGPGLNDPLFAFAKPALRPEDRPVRPRAASSIVFTMPTPPDQSSPSCCPHSPVRTFLPAESHGADRRDVICTSPLLLGRARQESSLTDSNTAPHFLPALRLPDGSPENSGSLKSPLLAPQSNPPNAFSSPLGTSLPTRRRDNTEPKTNRPRWQANIFGRLFSPKRSGENDFSTRENVLCGDGSVRQNDQRTPSEMSPTLRQISRRNSTRLVLSPDDRANDLSSTPLASSPRQPAEQEYS